MLYYKQGANNMFYDEKIDIEINGQKIDYDLFLKKLKEIEDNEKCISCGKVALVSFDPMEPVFLCSSCGHTEYYEINTDNEELI
jgi:predicted RNA-binding Zn-ribbon protein involved in translation (DUF1610 family)